MTNPQTIDGRRSRTGAIPDGLLSHHAIMTLVAAFSQKGYLVDLAASDRRRGLLMFRPVDLPAVPGRHPDLRCVLRLERPHRAKIRVIRTLECDDGLTATMTAEGDDPAVLLRVVEEVDPVRQFHALDTGLISRSYRAAVWSADAPTHASRKRMTALPRLTNAEARLGPVRLSVSAHEERSCELRLIADEGCRLDIPEDLLTVLAWCWRPLRRHDGRTWLGSVRLPRREPARTARLESLLDEAVAHLADTLAASPTRYHRRHRGARWRAAFQRMSPLLFLGGMTVGLISAVIYLPRTPVVHFLVLHSSILTIVVIALLDRAYRLEVPRPPGPLTQPQWCSIPDGLREANRR